MTTATASTAATPKLSRRVLGNLALAEAWRLARHPFVLAGAALGLLMMVTGSQQMNAAFELLLGFGVMPLCIGTCLAAHLLASRDARNNTAEVSNALPTPAARRTLGWLAALGGPLLLAAVCVAVGATALGAWDGVPVALHRGPTNLLLHPSELAQGVIGVAFFGALGIALGTWVPSRATLVVLLGALLVMFTVVGWAADGWFRWALPVTHHEYGISRWVQATPGAGYNVVEGYDRVALSWHLGYTAAFAALLGALAVLRHDRSHRTVAAVGITAVATLALAIVQVP